MLREAYSGAYRRCFLDSRLLFCQKKKLLPWWSKRGCWMKVGVCSPPTKPTCSTEGVAIQEEWMVCLPLDRFFLSSTWVSLISGHKLTGPSVNQSSEMIIAATLRSWTLWQFICMTGGNGTTAYSLQCKIHLLTSKQSSTIPDLVKNIVGFCTVSINEEITFFFCWDCFLLILKSATKDNNKKESRGF